MIGPKVKISTAALKEEAAQLVARAQQGDSECLPQLAQFLDANPQLWLQLTDVSRRTEAAVLEAVAPVDHLLRESFRRKSALLREELLESGDSALERLLIDRIVISWLWLASLEATLTQAQELPPATRREVERQRNNTDRRYQSAMKSLVMIRKASSR